MKPTWRWRVAPALLVLALATPVHGQSFGFPWWRDAQFQRELALTPDQSAKIEVIVQAALSHLRPKKQELDQEEEALSQMIAANADEALVTKQADKVEAIRSHMNKQRTLMLLHERQVLSPNQRVRLNKLYEQWEKDHRRPPRGDAQQGRGRQ
jgi:Spy/CpxP family protein refolding chaperone